LLDVENGINNDSVPKSNKTVNPSSDGVTRSNRISNDPNVELLAAKSE
jgi:hypothetical protein